MEHGNPVEGNRPCNGQLRDPILRVQERTLEVLLGKRQLHTFSCQRNREYLSFFLSHFSRCPFPSIVVY